MTTYAIRHSTRYEYELPVLHAHHRACLRPRALENQRVHSSRLEIVPAARHLARKRDYFGNDCDSFELVEAHDLLEVVCHSVVTVTAPPDVATSPHSALPWDGVTQRIKAQSSYLSQREFCYDSPLVRSHRLLLEYAAPLFTPGRPLLEAVIELNRRIFDDFEYDPTATDLSTPLGQVMRERRGVCQDFAHVAIGCLRSVGLPARYVSGYLETIPPPGKPRLVGADASHAWAATFIPEFGWVDLDPTNALLPSDRHVTVAWGRDFSDVSPLKGVVVGGGNHRLSVGVDVDPRGEGGAAPQPVSTVPPQAVQSQRQS